MCRSNVGSMAVREKTHFKLRGKKFLFEGKNMNKGQ